ncbi:hypothetical protein EPI10_031379 [Gossypium australe]|uniref:Uncharacterized protein n=1 Tax=Gossypium australe TaxID=47621 RepID=A0A5B6X396_9ROSI|nr:hypothetical protein EPI10_031379 [Gossypium australe]
MKINHNAQEIKKAPKKVGVFFKSTTCEKDKGSSSDDEEEGMAMFAKKFKKFIKFNFQRKDIIEKKGALKYKKKAMMTT